MLIVKVSSTFTAINSRLATVPPILITVNLRKISVYGTAEV